MKRFLLALSAAALCLALSPANPAAFSLRIFEAYRISEGKVVKSGDKSADISFYYQTRRMGMISYLGATKIKEFAVRPDPRSLTRAIVETWDDYVAGPAPGYYVIKGAEGRFYLVKLESFENQGKAASYWKMTFAPAEEIQPR
ncbi:MAG TPA: hypothetical protein VN442_05365 [Bryobacteraceae bacterium]|nr:hypothetical protein [Bryobacteraceae bacterium]